jgi:hypothetical protein
MLFERRIGHHASLVGPGFAQVERATVAS